MGSVLLDGKMVGLGDRWSAPEVLMIGAYLRVSSADQKHDSQRAEIQKYMKSNGISPKQVEWYADTETGTRLQRPEFDRLQGDIFAGKVKTVIIWKLDRLSRNLRDGVNVLADWAEKGLKIVVVTQQLELNGVVGRTIRIAWASKLLAGDETTIQEAVCHTLADLDFPFETRAEFAIRLQ